MSYKTVQQLVQLATEGASNREIAQKLGKSDAWVSRYLGAYASATPQLHAAWDENAISDEMALELAPLPDALQIETLDRILALPDRSSKVSRGIARKIVYTVTRAHRDRMRS